MPYLIDTDVLIYHLANVQEANQLLVDLAPEGIAISIITYMEVYQGISRNLDQETAQEQFQFFLEGVPVLPFSLSVARRCALLRERLKQEGKRVRARALDVMNATIAIENNLILVTHNGKDYEDIPDLHLYENTAFSKE